MDRDQQRRVGRPSENVLSRELIVETALELLDEFGPDGFGMKDVAQRLGVRPSALYNHVTNKEDVFRGVREATALRISVDSFSTHPWQDALKIWARSYRDAFAKHPPTVALLAVMPFQHDSEVFASYEQIVSVLHHEGWQRSEALNILVALESFILGSALDAAADPDMMSPGTRTDIPHFTAAYRDRQDLVTEHRVSPADQAFESGLSLFVLGLQVQQDARSRHTSSTVHPM